MKVLNIVNSFIGKSGNIGVRTARIIKELERQGIAHKSLSRGSVLNELKHNINMGMFGHFPRILNAARIYINKNFNHRVYDILLFEAFCQINLNKKYIEEFESPSVAHLWEFSPKIIKLLKASNFKVVLDVPIAPTSTSKELVKVFGNQIQLHPHESMLKLELESFELSDRIIVPSQFVKEEILKLGGNSKKIVVIPFGADSPAKSEAENFNKDLKNKSGLNFCFAGNISPRKGIDFLLEAWNSPLFVGDTLHLCGRMYPEIAEKIAKMGFKNVVTPGFVDTHKYFQNCDVYVLPSLLEGSSKSVYEALAAGLPSIVTPNVGSIVTDNKDGIIVSVANVESLRNAMIYLKSHPEKLFEMQANAVKTARQFTWEDYSRKVIEEYRDLVSKKPMLR